MHNYHFLCFIAHRGSWARHRQVEHSVFLHSTVDRHIRGTLRQSLTTICFQFLGSKNWLLLGQNIERSNQKIGLKKSFEMALGCPKSLFSIPRMCPLTVYVTVQRNAQTYKVFSLTRALAVLIALQYLWHSMFRKHAIGNCTQGMLRVGFKNNNRH